MGSVKKSVAERTHHKRQYDIRVNKRQMQTHASKVDSSKALDADLVVMESNMTESEKHDTSSSLGNYLTHVMNADIRPINDQMPFVENQRDLPRDNPLVSVEVLRYDIKRSKSENKGIVSTKMELVLEQTQQGTSHKVSVSTEGVEE
nr:hypothetical protein [Tanacetum cinerariifolium]